MTPPDVSTSASSLASTRSVSIAAPRRTIGITATGTAAASQQPGGWRAEARCRGEAAVDFFAPIAGETRRARAARERRAVAVCAECAVQQDCLNDAARRGERYGIWGGRSFDERTSLTHQRPPSDYSLPRPA